MVHDEKYFTVYIKGAIEVIWELCSNTYKDGALVPLGDLAQFNESKRLIAFAHRRLPRDIYHEDYLFNLTGEGYDFGFQEFTLLGVVSLNCQIRPGVKQILQDIRVANIKLVIM